MRDDIGAGDRVRVDIPDVTDPDFDAYHGREGVVVEVIVDDADAVTGDEADAGVYRVEFDDGDTADFRQRDLRSAFTNGCRGSEVVGWYKEIGR